jgi:hypothetical protein
MILGWPPSKFVSGDPTSNQDGRQAKNRKKGDDIKKKSSPLKLLSQSQANFAEMILDWFPSWVQDGADGHNFERGPIKDHFSKVCLRLAQ